MITYYIVTRPDDEFDEFNRQVNAASKIQYLKILTKNAK